MKRNKPLLNQKRRLHGRKVALKKLNKQKLTAKE
jgi:hypothetical protein